MKTSQPCISDSDEQKIQWAVHEAARLLPAQGPLSVFVHHNTLHAFEHLHFEEAVIVAAELLGCQPYPAESWYREEYRRGRIQESDLAAIVAADGIDAHIAPGVNRLKLRAALMNYELHEEHGPRLRWHLHETGALQQFRREIKRDERQAHAALTLAWIREQMILEPDPNSPSFVDPIPEEFDSPPFALLLLRNPRKAAIQALWSCCRRAVATSLPFASHEPQRPLCRHRDFLLGNGAGDSDALVDPFMIRFCAAFLDQGVASNRMLPRDEGMFCCFSQLYSLRATLPAYWLRGLSGILQDSTVRRLSALESVWESLRELGVAPPEWPDYIRQTLLILKGWAGMVYQAQLRPDRLPGHRVAADLLDYLAVRLILERCALRYCLDETGEKRLKLAEIRSGMPVSPREPDPNAGLFRLFQVVQFLGLGPHTILSWTPSEVQAILLEIDQFGDLERRRLFQLAYERRLRLTTLDALSLHFPQAPPPIPDFQAVFCIDEREESTRRHLEEIAPSCQTFSTPGFFGLPMYFKALHEHHAVPLCPVSIRPRHLIVEFPHQGGEAEAQRLAIIRRSLGQVAQGVQRGSQTLAWGGLLTSGLGILSSLPGLFRVLFPRAAGRLGRRLRKRLLPSETRLGILRDEAHPLNPEGLLLGFSIQEMATIVGSLLAEIGLIENFSSLVLVVGHGSSSLNNPHEAAYDCGACGGGRGGPNARVLAWMANQPEVRRLLAEQGGKIPGETRFVGAYHNTCSDTIDVFDLQDISEIHFVQLEKALGSLQEARGRDAVERCRRFESASLEITPRSALEHVEARSEDLAQPRPEYGHSTNACCIVGRRSRTRGLFLDRRAFLVSYDPDQDDSQGTILGRVLRSAVAVGAGINLEYYFSFVDNYGYGCGTKLPHNITGLLGVMDGYSSDLRTGLSWQMVEIHEPVRLLTVIETTLEILQKVLERETAVKLLVENGWVQVAVLDPHSQQIQVLRKTGWAPHSMHSDHLPVVRNSAEWFHNHRENLQFAEIRQDLPC